MARPLRIEYPGALYHITSRGNGGADIYRDDGDRQLFLDVLDTVCRRLPGVCYAYCLMSNHYHLVLETPEGNLSKGMRHLNGGYTRSVSIGVIAAQAMCFRGVIRRFWSTATLTCWKWRVTWFSIRCGPVW
jgi:REP element-mobilizing transposase RayT